MSWFSSGFGKLGKLLAKPAAYSARLGGAAGGFLLGGPGGAAAGWRLGDKIGNIEEDALAGRNVRKNLGSNLVDAAEGGAGLFAAGGGFGGGGGAASAGGAGASGSGGIGGTLGSLFGGKVGLGDIAQLGTSALGTWQGAKRIGQGDKLTQERLDQARATQADRDILRKRAMARLGTIPGRPNLGSLFAGSQNPFARKSLGPLMGNAA